MIVLNVKIIFVCFYTFFLFVLFLRECLYIAINIKYFIPSLTFWSVFLKRIYSRKFALKYCFALSLFPLIVSPFGKNFNVSFSLLPWPADFVTFTPIRSDPKWQTRFFDDFYVSRVYNEVTSVLQNLTKTSRRCLWTLLKWAYKNCNERSCFRLPANVSSTLQISWVHSVSKWS